MSLNNRQKISTEFLKSSFSQFYVRMQEKLSMGFKMSVLLQRVNGSLIVV